MDESDARARFVDRASTAATLIGLLVTWETIVRLAGVSPVVLPAPTRVGAALIAMIGSGALFPHLGITLSEILLGFASGAAVALILGALITEFRLVDRIITPYIISLQAVPKVAVAPLLVIWFGFGIGSKVLMTAVIAFFPILVNTVAGLRSVERDRLELMAALRASRWQTFRMVRLPTALPFIFAGLDVGIVLSVIGAIVGEFVGARGGVGYLILLHNADLRIDAVFALLVVLALVGVTLHSAVGWTRRRVMRWADAEPMRGPAA